MTNSVLRVNRAEPFDPAKLFGDGWTIWKGPADGDGRSGEPEHDARSIALAEVDLSKVTFGTCLKSGENYTTGNERLIRLAAERPESIRLDPAFAVALKASPEQYPEAWKKKINGYVPWVFFDGTFLRSPDGNRYALCAYWDGDEVVLGYDWLDKGRNASSPSALLASA